MSKKIAVLGGGHGAHTMAADFTLRGLKATMYEMNLDGMSVAQVLQYIRQ
jgi:hypothetical protein